MHEQDVDQLSGELVRGGLAAATASRLPQKCSEILRARQFDLC